MEGRVDSLLYATMLSKSSSVERSQGLNSEIKDKGSKGSKKEVTRKTRAP